LMQVHCSSSSTAKSDAGHVVVTFDSGADATVCGSEHESCCGASQTCDAGLTCNPNGPPLTCVACGGQMQPCCITTNGTGVNLACNAATLGCQSYSGFDAGAQTPTCLTCGGTNQPCCPTSIGGPQTVCSSAGACCDPLLGTCIAMGTECASGVVCSAETCGN
jgi:hypothetical protein